jgi:6-phosphogluconolactonase
MGLLSTVVAEVSASTTKHEVAQDLCRRVVELCQEAIKARGWFSVAISGGSLPDLLSNLPQAFRDAQVDPKYHRWLVLLADERGVPESHSDSNMRAIRRALLNKISVPAQQVYGIDVISLSESIDVAAQSYQTQLLSALSKTDDRLDLALLGFGPDGHTCSLFPNHLSLLQSTKLVMGVTNSPKPPSYRITLTLKTLNELTQHILVCGTGESKSLVLQEILQGTYRDGHGKTYTHVYPKYPCGMLRPKLQLVYICDEQALKGVYVASSQHEANHDATVNTGSHILARRGTSFLIKAPTAKIHVRDSKETLRQELYSQIVRCATVAIAERGAFTIALSGGSLPWLLTNLPRAFEEAGVNPCWHQWHILLADERCVPADHIDSNMHDIHKYLLADLYGQIVLGNIYGLDQVSLAESTDIVAQDYQRKLLSALTHSGGMLDLAVLGMGADGHTCSLFPGHDALTSTRWVAPITDSPKEPSHRITMTLTFLNHHTRNVLFVGMGEAKSGILKETLPLLRSRGLFFESEVDSIYPCGMIRPQDDLVYLVDDAAVSQCVVAPIDGTTLQYASVLVTPTKDDIPDRLHRVLIRESQKAIRLRGCFTVALSGGSLPSFLSGLDISFQHVCVDPQWNKWNVLLADERCVPTSHDDSNMGALTKELLHHIGIPSAQIYGIDESLLEAPAGIQAQAYESKLRSALSKSGGMLDLALLGFGPDGHTCSLFPGHALLQERYRWISGLEDSPKPPPKRVTLTLRVLNEYTRIVVFCGAGSSKQNVLERIFGVIEGRHGLDFHVCMNIGELPCSMVRPRDELYWIVDRDAMPTNMNMIASPSPRISSS